MSTITMIAEELNFWRGRLEELETASEVEPSRAIAVLADDAVYRITALERSLGYYQPKTSDEARLIAGLLVDRSREIDRDHIGAPGMNSLVTQLATSLLDHLDKHASRHPAGVPDGTTLSERLLEDLTAAWQTANKIDAEFLTSVEASQELKEARSDEAFSRIGALEEALAATRPTSSRDAAAMCQLLEYEIENLDVSSLEPRWLRMISMITRNLNEFLAASAGGSVELLPTAYRVKALTALWPRRSAGEVGAGKPH